MPIYVIVLTNRKTGLKTLMSSASQTRVFESYQEATFHAHQSYGANNPNVEYSAFKLVAKRATPNPDGEKTPMATNVYDREERIFFDHKNPVTLHGWHISGTSVDASVSGFHYEAIKTQYAKAVSLALRKSKSHKDADPNYVAAFAFGVFCGEDADLLMELLVRELTGGAEDIEIGDFYDEVLEPLARRFNEMDDKARLAELKKRR